MSVRSDPFRYFKTSPKIIQLIVMLCVRLPLSLRNVEDLLFERGIDISHGTVQCWWNRFGPLFASDIRRRRVDRIPLGQQPCREQPPALPTKGKGDAAVSTEEIAAKVRFRPR